MRIPIEIDPPKYTFSRSIVSIIGRIIGTGISHTIFDGTNLENDGEHEVDCDTREEEVDPVCQLRSPHVYMDIHIDPHQSEEHARCASSLIMLHDRRLYFSS